MNIDAYGLKFKELNEKIAASGEDVIIDNCLGQRFILSGGGKRKLVINGTPGNALGAYLDGAEIEVNGNAQDAVGDTMNDGKIIVRGNIGDAPGYGMRGGKIYVLGNAGYRTGIHMKEYSGKKPVIIIGGGTGSFLGEYMAGGIIIVLGLNGKKPLVGNFTGTGMHGSGKIFLRASEKPAALPEQVSAEIATPEDLKEIEDYLKEYASVFGISFEEIVKEKFLLLKPNTANPYNRLYIVN
jgi:Glutamate synthase domain 3